jgi:predicted nucleic acid-binding protein
MKMKQQILVDSDAFIGQAYPDDAHHQRCKRLFDQLLAEGKRLVTTSSVVAETATVLSHKLGQADARKFLDEVIAAGGFPVVFVDEGLHREALELFKSVDKKGMSVVDCANVAVARRLGIGVVFSFDQVYEAKFGLRLAERAVVQ